MAAGIEDEPALSGMARAEDLGADAIGGEAALADSPEAVQDKARSDEALRGLWKSPPRRGAVLRIIGLCVYVWVTGSQPRTAGYRTRPRRGSRIAQTQSW